MMNVVFVGHSHIGSIVRYFNLAGCQHQCTVGYFPLDHPVHHRRDRYLPLIDHDNINPHIVEDLVSLLHEDGMNLIVSVHFGNDHNAFGIVGPDVPYDFIIPNDSTHYNTSFDIVPHALIDSIAHERLAPTRQYLTLLTSELRRVAAHYKLSIFHLAAPSVIPDDAHLRSHAGPLETLFSERGVNDKYVRLKIWKVWMAHFASICKELGIGFVPNPTEVLDDESFLRAGLWANDATHGNVEYGRAVVTNLFDNVLMIPRNS